MLEKPIGTKLSAAETAAIRARIAEARSLKDFVMMDDLMASTDASASLWNDYGDALLAALATAEQENERLREVIAGAAKTHEDLASGYLDYGDVPTEEAEAGRIHQSRAEELHAALRTEAGGEEKPPTCGCGDPDCLKGQGAADIND